MPAFSPSTHKGIVSATSNLKDALPVDTRDMITRLMLDLGVYAIQPGTTPPSDRDVLWYNTDTRTFRRYDGVLNSWGTATGNQVAMHVMRRALLGSLTEINLDAADLFMFWDVSQGDWKKITKADLSSIIVQDAIAALNGQRVFIDTSAGPQSVTLPASPSNNDRRRFYDRKGTFSSVKAATINRNGKTINLTAANLVLDIADVGVELTYNSATNDWQITELFRSNTR